MRILLIVAALLLAGCAAAPPKTNPPAPSVIKVPVATYVPVDPALTKRCGWVRSGQPSAVFEISNGRKRCLDLYEAQFDAIEKVQGKPVPAVGNPSARLGARARGKGREAVERGVEHPGRGYPQKTERSGAPAGKCLHRGGFGPRFSTVFRPPDAPQQVRGFRGFSRQKPHFLS